MKPLILGSSSPRRKEILSFFSLPFIQATPDFDEESHPFQGDPEQYAVELAGRKALALQFPENVILTADTVVFKAGKVYAKPKNYEESCSFIQELSGGSHSVFTAVTGRFGEKMVTQVAKTLVHFHPLTEVQVKKYCDSLETLDKAGGYAIQGKGALIVKHIEGCYYNVMGLPIDALHQVLLHFNIDLWDWL